MWIFPSNRPLSPEEQTTLGQAVEESLQGWSAHGSVVTWGYEVLHRQFLVIAVNETTTALSGCSIDNATRKLKALESELGLVLLDNGRVIYEQAGEIVAVPRSKFRELAAQGEVSSDTVVFDTVVQSLGEQRNGLWKTQARNTWHARAFPLAS